MTAFLLLKFSPSLVKKMQKFVILNLFQDFLLGIPAQQEI